MKGWRGEVWVWYFTGEPVLPYGSGEARSPHRMAWTLTRAKPQASIIISSEPLSTKGGTCTYRLSAGVYALETGVGVPRVEMTYHERLDIEPGAGKCAVEAKLTRVRVRAVPLAIAQRGCH